MLTTLMIGALALFAAVQERGPHATDTTISVPKGARLEVKPMGGEIVVRTWNRDAVRVRATHSSRSRVGVALEGSVVKVRARAQYGPANLVDYDITVPADMPLSLGGTFSDVTVEGSEAEVDVSTVQGIVVVRGGRGRVNATSINGDVTIEKARGRVVAKSVSANVRLTDVIGDVIAETTSGDVTMERMDVTTLTASTVSGNVSYAGTVKSGGQYSLVSHSGNVTLSVPDTPNAAFSVATVTGDFQTSFTVSTADFRPRRRFSFTLGSGSARVEMESFSGNIRVRRATASRED